MKKIVITLKADSDRVQIVTTGGGGNEIRFVSTADFIAAVLEYSANTEYFDVTCPPNCVKASINRKGERRAEFVIPGRKRIFFYYGDQYVIPMPTLHFKLETVSGGKGWVWVEEKGKKYLYPFGNVGTDNHICFGNVTRDKVKDFSDFINWVESFFSSKTNDDYYNQKAVVVDGERISQRELLSRLQDMETFPEEWLIPTEEVT